MKKIIFIVFSLILFSISYAGEETSGIGKIEYKVKWCNPVFGCKIGYFNGNTIGPKPTDGFEENSDFHTICNGSCTTDKAVKNLFSDINLKGEGVYTITIKTYDNVKWGSVKKCDGSLSSPYEDGKAPGNCSQYVFTYKIDKTQPNIVNPGLLNSSYPQIDEGSKKVYIGRSDKNTDIKINNALNGGYVNGEKFIKPNYNIVDDSSIKIANRQKLKTIYYSNGNENITIKLNLKNYYDNETNYNGNISKLTKIQLLDSGRSVKKTWDLSVLTKNNWTVSSKINNLFGDADEKIFYFRIYDEAGNFSETPVYIVKDISKPISLTDFVNTFSFDGTNEKVFYTTTQNGPKINGKNSIPSKFFAANDNLGLKFSISDKTEGDEKNTSNSGILKFRFRLENVNNCNNYDETTFIPSDNLDQTKGTTVSQTFSVSHNFSKVDKCVQDTNKTYRYYRAHIVSIDDDGNEYQDKICDKVGNCTTIAPLTFRVVANKINDTNSKIQLLTNNLVNGKMLANGKSNYQLFLSLKDKYDNKVVPVYSQEDNKEIKDVILTGYFDNGLYLDQIHKSGPFGTWVKDNEGDDDITINSSFSDNIKLSENSKSTPNGNYNVTISSYVPTNKYYPWLADSAKLILTKINFDVSDKTNNGLMVKKDNIGKINITRFSSNENEINLNKGDLAYSKTANKYLDLSSNNYGKLVSNPLSTESSFSSKNKKIVFHFASPVIIGLDKLQNISEGVKNTYNYNLWNIDPSSISGGNFSIVENWVNNNIYDFTQGTGSNSLNGEIVELVGKNFESISDLAVIGTFNSNKNISKYTKISIDPDLLPFSVGENDNHIALGTKIIYKIGANKVILPADGRGVNGSNFDDSRKILKLDNFNKIDGPYDDGELQPLTKNIKVLGTVSTNNASKNLLATDKKRNIGGDIRKWQIKNKLNKKIAQMMRGQTWGNTCVAGSCDSFDLNGETIYAIDGNLTFDGDYSINGRQTYIVKGNVYINGNLYKNDKNALLTIVALNPDSFVKKSIDLKNLTFDTNSKGFIFINPKVTNIDAFIYAQGSLLSYDGNKIFNGANTMDTDLDMYNQLYIRGGIISTNTIGGSRLPDTELKKCPWFVKDCNTNVAQAFDLIYLRRYMLTDAKIYGATGSAADIKIPYIPVSVASDISSYNSKHPFMGGKKVCEISLDGKNIDCSVDKDGNLKNIPDSGKEYPLYIEFDSLIKIKTPFVFTN